MSAIENIYDYFEDHSKAAAYTNEFRPIVFGTLCYALGGASWFLAQAMSHRFLLMTFSFPSLFLTMLWEIGTGFVLASVLHLILEIEGVQGGAASLYSLLGMADLVWAMAIPWLLITRLILPDSRWPAALVFFIVGLMSLGLKARSVRDNYKISASRAWVTLLLPYLALVVFSMLAFFLLAWITVLKLIQM